MPDLTAAWVKEKAYALGADLVGIASAANMNANPPDPKWPQTPERLWPECRSVIVVAKRMPARCSTALGPEQASLCHLCPERGGRVFHALPAQADQC